MPAKRKNASEHSEHLIKNEPSPKTPTPRRPGKLRKNNDDRQLSIFDSFGKKRQRDSDEPLQDIQPKVKSSRSDGDSSPDEDRETALDVFKKDEVESDASDKENKRLALNEAEPEKASVDSKPPERCHICKQNINDPDFKLYYGHPQNAVEEYIALTDENLTLASGDDGDIMDRPHVNITGYSVYDKDGHLCPFDEGLIESDVKLYLSGYLKSICADSADINGECVPVKDIGPIVEWSVHGFDGGQNNCITLSSEFGEYNLLKPSDDYAQLLNNLYERIRITKTVVEYLEEFHYLLPNYEDLLLVLAENTIPELDNKYITEEMLHKHAKYVCDQVANLEVDDEDVDEPPLITLPCMRELIKLVGIKIGKTSAKSKINYDKTAKKRSQTWTKATTTPLVRKTFEMFFSNQLDKTEKTSVLRRKRCGICDHCQKPDCGECQSCRAMGKFGGGGKNKKACLHRKCPNMAIEEAEESDPDNEDDSEINETMASSEENVQINLNVSGVKTITWPSESVKSENCKVYYASVQIDNLTVTVGDFVMVETSSPSIPHIIARIVCMWKEQLSPKVGYFHGEIFCRANATILGEVSDPREIFLQGDCCSKAPLSSIARLANVHKKAPPSNWFQLGGKDFDEEILEDDGRTYYYQKAYNKMHARFEDLPEDPKCPIPAREHRFCPSCERRGKKFQFSLPQVIEKYESSEEQKKSNRYEWGAVKWKGFEYRRGNGVFLKPGAIKLKNYQNSKNQKSKTEKVDETIYTEYYRKNDGSLCGSNADTVEPFCVAYINAIYSKRDGDLVVPQDIFLRVNIMYRPENTKKENAYKDDLNLVYWSDEEKEMPFSNVVLPCHLTYIDNIPEDLPLNEWSSQDFNRFYFKEAYNSTTGAFENVPAHAKKVGETEKVKIKSKGKGKGKSSKQDPKSDLAKEDKSGTKPLRMLDVFAGCGGLSEGLHQSGVAVSKWAIEQVTRAAKAYQLNNGSCTVFTDDCNKLLKLVLDGETHTAGGQRLPAKGDVELLCGGPPCQGFSGMNRFTERDYSNFKNSLVASYLSYCDYYRPKYFVLENVRNFVAYKKGLVLKLTLRCLLQIGYQCTFGIVQAGNYGVPQTRRRLIILAAAPGCKLPEYPMPTHVFTRRACSLTVAIDGKRYDSNISLCASAPRRTCTIRDAMSDLPAIPNGATKLEIEYGSAPESDFQRAIRSRDENAKLQDHICKNMTPLIQARIVRIPTTPGSDWRDLPNIAVTLSDGTKSKVLQYLYHDIKNGRGPGGVLRGVCSCAKGLPCGPRAQDNTLIPWCLPHTGNRHNNWAGLYGRVSWDGYFSTTVTDPEPMGKQGRILHPEQHRVVSVRECARSQGFPDSYVFVGSISDKHRQIGNAVPPPLGAALGREIKKAIMVKE